MKYLSACGSIAACFSFAICVPVSRSTHAPRAASTHEYGKGRVPPALELRARVEPTGVDALQARVTDLVNHARGDPVVRFALDVGYLRLLVKKH